MRTNVQDRWVWTVALSVTLGVVVMGCADTGRDGGLAGVWRYETGPLLAAITSTDEAELRYLVLNQDGTAVMHLEQEAPGVAICKEGVYQQIGDSAMVLQVLSQFYDEGAAEIYLSSLPDPDTLELIDNNGQVSRFTRRQAVPEEFQCREFVVVQTFSDLAALPPYQGGLAYDGVSLWYEETDTQEVFPADPATGVLATPVALGASEFTHVHAVQSDDFWLTRWWGGSSSCQRRTQADVLVDEVETDNTGLNEEIGIRALAFDSSAMVLWLHGDGVDDDVYRFLKVDSEAEPDVLLETGDFNVRLAALTWDGTHLWGVTEAQLQTVVQIDIGTFEAVASYRVPDSGMYWVGIAAIDGSLFLLGRDYYEYHAFGQLVEVLP